MKRIAIASIMVVYMCCAGVVTAQRPVGDTIFGRDSTFFYYPIYDWIRVDDRNWGVENGFAHNFFIGQWMERMRQIALGGNAQRFALQSEGTAGYMLGGKLLIQHIFHL